MKKPILKFIWNCKGPRIVITILRKSRTHTLQSYYLKMYLYSNIIQTAWHIPAQWPVEQHWESRDTSVSYGQLIFNKGTKTGERSIFNKWCWLPTRIYKHQLTPDAKEPPGSGSEGRSVSPPGRMALPVWRQSRGWHSRNTQLAKDSTEEGRHRSPWRLTHMQKLSTNVHKLNLSCTE